MNPLLQATIAYRVLSTTEKISVNGNCKAIVGRGERVLGFNRVVKMDRLRYGGHRQVGPFEGDKVAVVGPYVP